MLFVFVLWCVVECDVMVKCDVVVDFCGFIDYYIYVVVDEEVVIDGGVRMNFYVGEEMGKMCCKLCYLV